MRLTNILKKYASKKETPLLLTYLNTHNPIKYQSIFLKEELSIRLSHRIFDLLKLPYGLPMIPEIKSVINLYYNSFEKINLHPRIMNIENVESFTITLDKIKNNHKNLEYTIAEGLKKLDNPLIDYNIINKVLDTFFLSRISIRTLISHQINTFNKDNPVITNCILNKIIDDVIYDITNISNLYYCYEPKIIYTNNFKDDIYLHYIKSHLYYIINEILKNSIMAHSKNNIDEPIHIFTDQTDKYIIININDKGLGFDIDDLNKIMSYSYSTTPINNINNSYILSGLGFGLPLTKLYIKYFGGKLFINPIEKSGTNIYIYIKKLDNTLEHLNIFN